MRARSGNLVKSGALHLEADPSSISMKHQNYVRTKADNLQCAREDLVSFLNTQL